MAVTAIAEQEVLGAYVLETATQFTTLTETAGDPTNMNSVVMGTGRCLMIFHNSDGANPYWVTVESSNDPQGRTADITEVDIAANGWVARIFEARGWEQTLGGRNLLFDTENVAIKVIAIPI